MPPVVPTYTVAGLVATIRTDSDLNRSQVYTDAQIAALISDAGSALQDIFTQANQHYNISTFSFTLVGGPGQNTVPLPVDFQQGHSVDVNPGTAQPYTLRYLPNWLDRNRLNNAMPFAIGGPGGGPREYYILGAAGAGGVLGVLPATGAAGNYMLYYTPMWTPLALPLGIPPDNSGIAPVIASFAAASTINFTHAAWTAANIGDVITISGATNAANNGVFTIATVPTANQITVTATTLVNEGVTTATLVDQPVGTTGTLPTFMNPWVRYLKTQACITIRNKRGQDVQSFMTTLGIDQERIDAIVQNRQEEPTQPPLTRNTGWWGGW